jgi:TolB-like protein/Tfp pilus assembly protein PilF
MSENPDKLSRIWQELKRRRVLHVITVYASASFVIIELINNVLEPLNLPEKLPNIAIVALAIGFPLTIALAWIFNINPKGFQESGDQDENSQKSQSRTPNSWKIATYVSVVIIIALLVVNIFGGQGSGDRGLDKSIAVLPFLNYSTEEGQDLMCLGLTSEIINHLYKIGSFDKVISLRSGLAFAGTSLKMPQIADELGVNYLLDGTYKKIGEKVRVTVQLIEGKRDNTIWQTEYDRPYAEIINIQNDIALKIADQLKAFISPDEKKSIEKIPTTNIYAYELLKSIRYHYQIRDYSYAYKDSILKVIELDPQYADAYAILGYLAISGVSFNSITNVDGESIWGGEIYLNKALELDPENLWAHFILGIMNSWIKWDYIAAEKEFRKVLELTHEQDDYFRGGYCEFLVKRNRLHEALSYRPKEYWLNSVARIHALKGDFDTARAIFSRQIGLFGSAIWPEVGDGYIWLNEYDSVLYYLESATQAGDMQMYLPRFQASLALAYQRTDQPDKARKVLDQLIYQGNDLAPSSPNYFLGWYYSHMGEVDSAFYWLERAFRNRSAEIPWLKVDPAFDVLKDDERYWDLYERTGHKAYDDYLDSHSN